MQAAYYIPMSDVIVIGMPMWHTGVVDTQELKRLADAYHRAQKTADERRAVLFGAIREAAEQTGDAEIKQVEIVNATGFTREHIRRIVKAGKDGD
jgi:hypothetical protein